MTRRAGRWLYIRTAKEVFRVSARDAGRGGGKTGFGRVTERLGIGAADALIPQAKGQVERANRTLQDRLIEEMHLRTADGRFGSIVRHGRWPSWRRHLSGSGPGRGREKHWTRRLVRSSRHNRCWHRRRDGLTHRLTHIGPGVHSGERSGVRRPRCARAERPAARGSRRLTFFFPSAPRSGSSMFRPERESKRLTEPESRTGVVSAPTSARTPKKTCSLCGNRGHFGVALTGIGA